MKMRVYAGSERYTTRRDDRVTHHSLAFGKHYDPDNVSFGALVAHDDHRLSWGAGFADHAHADVELVTWVLRGQLVHTDSLGNRSLLPAGTVQVQSAGSGIRHAEFADTSSEPTRFVQSWLTPDEPGEPPSRFVASGLAGPGLVAVAGEGAEVPVGTAGATLWVGTLDPGSSHPVPPSPRHHLFVARGTVRVRTPISVEPVTLASGDALRTVEESGDDAFEQLEILAATEAVVLLWTLP
ncbi:pirin family protein [Nocardioides sp. 616]|uniref:pirin family protein n=1 Tax=Nocardioides sp. 616 TaxID=2268090 RepID=UPI000CE37573|nr:pirin family protein [Nocardioides sp. 616]